MFYNCNCVFKVPSYMMIHVFSHRIVSLIFVEDSVQLQTNLLNEIFYKRWPLYLNFYILKTRSAVLRMLVLFSLRLQQMITFYLTASDWRRNKSEHFSGRFSQEAFHKYVLLSKTDLLLNRAFLKKNIETKHPQKMV